MQVLGDANVKLHDWGGKPVRRGGAEQIMFLNVLGRCLLPINYK
jgi:hypothetical protein